MKPILTTGQPHLKSWLKVTDLNQNQTEPLNLTPPHEITNAQAEAVLVKTTIVDRFIMQGNPAKLIPSNRVSLNDEDYPQLKHAVSLDNEVVLSHGWQNFYGGRASFCNIGLVSDVQSELFVGFHAPLQLSDYIKEASRLIMDRGGKKQNLKMHLVLGTDYRNAEQWQSWFELVRDIIPNTIMYPSFQGWAWFNNAHRNWIVFSRQGDIISLQWTPFPIFLGTPCFTQPLAQWPHKIT